MKKILLIALVIARLGLWSQSTPSIYPQVINSAGSHRQAGGSGIWLTDNVGEPFVETKTGGNFIITQGFLQPLVVSIGGFSISSSKQDLICLDKESDAFISTALTIPGNVKSYSTKYFWNKSSLCPNNDCSRVDTLTAGDYSVTVAITYTTNAGAVKTDTARSSIITINDAKEPCKVKLYSGVTPNSDGVNDNWVIGNISEFPNNKVSIYNRWGIEVFSTKGYDNKSKYWPTQDMLGKLPSSTYFYIIDLGDGSKLIKGWVELIKNE